MVHATTDLNVPDDHRVAIAIQHVLPIRVSIDHHGHASLSEWEGAEHILCTEINKYYRAGPYQE